MGWLEFIDKTVGHIAWPAATIVIVVIIRHHLGGVLAALKSLKLPGGVELELHDRFKELREQAEAAKLPIPDQARLADDKNARVLRMAEDFPQAAIMDTWIGLEKEIMDAAEGYARPTMTISNRPRLLQEALQDLRLNEAVDLATLQVIDRLRRIRNEVVHARRETVTPGEALEFRELASAVIARLHQIKH